MPVLTREEERVNKNHPSRYTSWWRSKGIEILTTSSVEHKNNSVGSYLLCVARDITCGNSHPKNKGGWHEAAHNPQAVLKNPNVSFLILYTSELGDFVSYPATNAQRCSRETAYNITVPARAMAVAIIDSTTREFGI
jgi:hypothetical protein